MKRVLNFLLCGRNFNRTMGVVAALLWGLLVWQRPAFYVQEGGLLFAIAAVVGGFFIVFPAVTTWFSSYWLKTALLQVTLVVLGFGAVFWGHSIWWIIPTLFLMMVSQSLMTVLFRPPLAAVGQGEAQPPERGGASVTPSNSVAENTEWKFTSTKRFYEVYWFVMSVFGLTCDGLHRYWH